MRKTATPELHVYFDMDGVLVKFNEQDAVTKPFLTRNSHYFRSQPPDTKAVDLMRCLDEFPKIKTRVLTRLMDPLDPDLADEHERDKRLWCLDHKLSEAFDGPDREDIPFLCLRNTNDKAGILRAMPAGTDLKRHVLIDDDPFQLSAWLSAGGAAYQYRQYGRTNPVWGRDVLYWDMRVPDMVDMIMRCLY